MPKLAKFGVGAAVEVAAEAERLGHFLHDAVPRRIVAAIASNENGYVVVRPGDQGIDGAVEAGPARPLAVPMATASYLDCSARRVSKVITTLGLGLSISTGRPVSSPNKARWSATSWW